MQISQDSQALDTNWGTWIRPSPQLLTSLSAVCNHSPSVILLHHAVGGSSQRRVHDVIAVRSSSFAPCPANLRAVHMPRKLGHLCTARVVSCPPAVSLVPVPTPCSHRAHSEAEPHRTAASSAKGHIQPRCFPMLYNSARSRAAITITRTVRSWPAQSALKVCSLPYQSRVRGST